MDYDEYFHDHLTTMQMQTKKLLSNNNWYFQRTADDVNTSTRPYSVGKNQLIPVIFQDKSFDVSELKNNKKKESSDQSSNPHENNKSHNQNENNNPAQNNQTRGLNDDNRAANTNEENINEVPEDATPVLVSKSNDSESDEEQYDKNPQTDNKPKPVHNKRFGLIAYNIRNIETDVKCLVISEPPGPDKLHACEFDEDGASFVWKYAKGIGSKKCDAYPSAKEDVKNWLCQEISPMTVNEKYKLQPVNQFITGKYGANYKNTYQRVLSLNKLIVKTPLSEYEQGPYSIFTGKSGDENELVNSLEVLPAFTILSEPKYGSYNVDQATLNKLAMLAVGTNDPTLAKEAIIKQHEIDTKARKEVAKRQRELERNNGAPRQRGRRRAVQPIIGEQGAHENEDIALENSESEEDDDEEADENDEQAIQQPANLASTHRQLHIKMDTVLQSGQSIIQVLKIGDDNVTNTYGVYMGDQKAKRQRTLQVKLYDGALVTVSIKDTFLLEQI